MSHTDRNWRHLVGTLLLVAVVAPFIVYAVPQVVGASQSYVVLSDSMSPTIQAGDVVVVEPVPPDQIETGDVITFEQPGDEARLVTHRVVGVVHENGQLKFQTRGDANEESDARLVPASSVTGVVRFHIPLIGYVIQFGQTDLGTVLLLLVPAVLLVVNELRAPLTPGDREQETPDPTETVNWDRTDEPAPQRGDDR